MPPQEHNDDSEFERTLARLPIESESASSLKEVHTALPSDVDRRALEIEIRGIADESDELSAALARLGEKELPASISQEADPALLEAAAGYGRAREIVSSLPQRFRSASRQVFQVRRELARALRAEKDSLYEARKTAELATAANLETVLDIYNAATDRESLEPQMTLHWVLFKRQQEQYDGLEKILQLKEELYQTVFAFEFATVMRHRIALFGAQLGVLAVRAVCILVVPLGFGILLMGVLTDLVPDWIYKTLISIAGAIVAAFPLGYLASRFLGSRRTLRVRRLASWYIQARVALAGMSATHTTLIQQASSPDQDS